MTTCAYSPCSNLGEVEHVIEAPFNINSSSSGSRQIVKICKPCDLMRKALEKTPGQLNIGHSLG